MKKVILLVLGIIFNINLIYAGGWQCILVKVYIETDTETIIGYIEFGEEYWNDENNLLNHIYGDTLSVYDTIYNLNYPIVEGYKLTASLEEDIRKIPIRNIKNISCISKGPCQEWRPERDPIHEEYYYAWTGIYVPIMELTKEEIKLLQKEPIFSVEQAQPLYENELESFHIVSYSNTISKEEVMKKIKTAADLIKNYSGKNPDHEVHKEVYQELKKEMRQNNVIIFKIFWTA